jgi:hypothetical protein
MANANGFQLTQTCSEASFALEETPNDFREFHERPFHERSLAFIERVFNVMQRIVSVQVLSSSKRLAIRSQTSWPQHVDGCEVEKKTTPA